MEHTYDHLGRFIGVCMLVDGNLILLHTVQVEKEVKKVVRRAKNNEWSDLARELEAHAQVGQKSFWTRLRILGGRGRHEVFSRVKMRMEQQ